VALYLLLAVLLLLRPPPLLQLLLPLLLLLPPLRHCCCWLCQSPRAASTAGAYCPHHRLPVGELGPANRPLQKHPIRLPTSRPPSRPREAPVCSPGVCRAAVPLFSGIRGCARTTGPAAAREWRCLSPGGGGENNKNTTTQPPGRACERLGSGAPTTGRQVQQGDEITPLGPCVLCCEKWAYRLLMSAPGAQV
jgi:hypothetical protein